MTVLKSWLNLVIAFIVTFPFSASAVAHADTYQILNLGTDSYQFFYGMDDAGTVVFSMSGASTFLCGMGADTCYRTYVNGLPAGYTTTAPNLAYNNGAPCTPDVPSGGIVIHGVCNNGREAFTGYVTEDRYEPGIYSGPNADLVAMYGGLNIFMNGQGDIVFQHGVYDEWLEAINLTTPEVPEPNSLFLLGTGALAVAVRMRRLSS